MESMPPPEGAATLGATQAGGWRRGAIKRTFQHLGDEATTTATTATTTGTALVATTAGTRSSAANAAAAAPRAKAAPPPSAAAAHSPPPLRQRITAPRQTPSESDSPIAALPVLTRKPKPPAARTSAAAASNPRAANARAGPPSAPGPPPASTAPRTKSSGAHQGNRPTHRAPPRNAAGAGGPPAAAPHQGGDDGPPPPPPPSAAPSSGGAAPSSLAAASPRPSRRSAVEAIARTREVLQVEQTPGATLAVTYGEGALGKPVSSQRGIMPKGTSGRVNGPPLVFPRLVSLTFTQPDASPRRPQQRQQQQQRRRGARQPQGAAEGGGGGSLLQVARPSSPVMEEQRRAGGGGSMSLDGSGSGLARDDEVEEEQQHHHQQHDDEEEEQEARAGRGAAKRRRRRRSAQPEQRRGGLSEQGREEEEGGGEGAPWRGGGADEEWRRAEPGDLGVDAGEQERRRVLGPLSRAPLLRPGASSLLGAAGPSGAAAVALAEQQERLQRQAGPSGGLVAEQGRLARGRRLRAPSQQHALPSAHEEGGEDEQGVDGEGARPLWSPLGATAGGRRGVAASPAAAALEAAAAAEAAARRALAAAAANRAQAEDEHRREQLCDAVVGVLEQLRAAADRVEAQGLAEGGGEALPQADCKALVVVREALQPALVAARVTLLPSDKVQLALGFLSSEARGWGGALQGCRSAPELVEYVDALMDVIRS